MFTRKRGSPARDFRKAGTKACEEAKVPALLLLDLRRTAARNLRNSGTAEEVIIEIGGWRAPSVFKQYAILDQTDKRSADWRSVSSATMQKLPNKTPMRRRKRFGHDLGIVAPRTVQCARLPL